MSSQPIKNPDLEALASEDQAALKETKMSYEQFEKEYHEAIKSGMKYQGLVASSFFSKAADLEECFPEFAARADEALA